MLYRRRRAATTISKQSDHVKHFCIFKDAVGEDLIDS